MVAPGGLGQHFALVRQSGAVESGPCPDAFVERNAPELAHPYARCRSVAYPHLAYADDVGALVKAHRGQFVAGFDGLVHLFQAHGRAVKEIGRAAGNLPVGYRGVSSEVMVDAHVYNVQFEPVLSAKHVNASAALGEVDHLLPCHLARRHAHAFAR